MYTYIVYINIHYREKVYGKKILAHDGEHVDGHVSQFGPRCRTCWRTFRWSSAVTGGATRLWRRLHPIVRTDHRPHVRQYVRIHVRQRSRQHVIDSNIYIYRDVYIYIYIYIYLFCTYVYIHYILL